MTSLLFYYSDAGIKKEVSRFNYGYLFFVSTHQTECESCLVIV